MGNHASFSYVEAGASPGYENETPRSKSFVEVNEHGGNYVSCSCTVARHDSQATDAYRKS